MNKKTAYKIILAELGLFIILGVIFYFADLKKTFQASEALYIGETVLNYNQKEIEKIQQRQSNNFSFAVLSDSHVSPEDGGNAVVFTKIIKDIRKNNYSFAIDIGDLVVGSKTQTRPFFYELIKDEKTPFLVAPGNHDLENDGGKYFVTTFGNLYYSFNYGNSLFIIANDAAVGSMDKKQLDWLQQQLARDFQHKFVLMHVPFKDPRTNTSHDLISLTGNDKETTELTVLMEKYKPDLVFFGHIHASYDWTQNGVEYMTTGGAGGGSVGNSPEHDFNNYIKVEVNGNNVTKQVIKIP